MITLLRVFPRLDDGVDVQGQVVYLGSPCDNSREAGKP